MQTTSKTIANRLPILSLFAALLLLAFSACQKEVVEPQEVASADAPAAAADRSSNTVVDVALSSPDFSSLVAAVVKTSSAGLLSSSSLNSTVFAPNNAAFAQLPAPFNNAANISAITSESQINTLREILRYHIVKGRRTASQLPNGSYQTLKNAANPNGNLLFVGRSVNNEVFINGVSKVVAADVQASNGTIHVIDQVLAFPSKDIAQVAIGAGSFRALVAALNKTGLTNLMTSKQSNFTVFAPTDAAFAALPAPLNNADNISKITDPNTIATLRNVLLYHAIGARVFSVDLREGITPTTTLGRTVSISLVGGAKVKGSGNPVASNISATNIMATNGVIHVIDRVLLP